MSLGKSIVQGMMGAYLMEGVDVLKIDWDNHILYLSIPKHSYTYEKPDGKIHSAEDFAKRIKETWIEMGVFPETCSVKYKVKDVKWTKEMGDKNYNDNLNKVLDLTMWS